MKRGLRQYGKHCGPPALLLSLWALLIPTPAAAAPENCPEARSVGAQALNELTWRKLNAVREAMAEQRHAQAREDLRAMLESSQHDDYLAAILNQALAQVEWAGENYAAALPHIERAIASDTLPDGTHFSLMYQAAQLYALQGRLEEALEQLERWFCGVAAEQVTAHAHVLKASILAQQGRYAETLAAIDHAIGMDREPLEAWYQLKLAAHFELEQYAPAAAALETMIVRWPGRKTYWLQLSQLNLSLGRDNRALAVLALAHRSGLLDEPTDIELLSGLYATRGVPYRAARVLEQGIADGLVPADRERWVRLAEHWFAAQEREEALLAYSRAAAQSDDGIPDLRRGYLLVELERWPEAVDALDRALEKGGMDETRTGEALLMRGMAHFSLAQYDRARADWEQAGRFENTRQSAQRWIDHLQQMRRRATS